MTEHMTAEQLRAELVAIAKRLRDPGSFFRTNMELAAMLESLAEHAARISGMAATPLGWAVIDRHGVVSRWVAARDHFFGDIQANEPPDAEWIEAHDRNYAGAAPHTVVTVYAAPEPPHG